MAGKCGTIVGSPPPGVPPGGGDPMRPCLAGLRDVVAAPASNTRMHFDGFKQNPVCGIRRNP